MTVIAGVTKYQASSDGSPAAIGNRQVLLLAKYNGTFRVVDQMDSDVSGNYSFDIASTIYDDYLVTAVDDLGIPWEANLDVLPGDRIRPSGVFAGYVYDVTVAGNLGSTEPTWWTTHGQSGSIGAATAVAKEYAQPESHGPFKVTPSIPAILDPNHADLTAFYDGSMLDEVTLADISGNGNHGTLASAVLQVMDGRFGHALAFGRNGAHNGGYVAIPGAVWLNENVAISLHYTQPIANVGWSPYEQAVISRNGSGESVSTNYNRLSIDTGNWKLFTETGGGANHDYDLGFDREIGVQWHHAAFWLGSGVISAWQNKAQVVSNMAIVNSDTTAPNAYLGGDTGNSFHGQLARIRIFSRTSEFTQAEIDALADEVVL